MTKWWPSQIYIVKKTLKITKLPNSLVPVFWSTTKESLFLLLLNILIWLMNNSRSGKWISYNVIYLMDIYIYIYTIQSSLKTYIYIYVFHIYGPYDCMVMVCMFSNWTEVFPCNPFKKRKKKNSYLGKSSILHCDGETYFIDWVQFFYRLFNLI